MDDLATLLPPGLLIVADSALGHIKNLCEADRAGLRFIVALRASTGFFDRFRTDAGHQALRPVQYVSRREQHLPPDQRTRYRGALRDFAVTDPETGAERRFRAAYTSSNSPTAPTKASSTSDRSSYTTTTASPP